MNLPELLTAAVLVVALGLMFSVLYKDRREKKQVSEAVSQTPDFKFQPGDRVTWRTPHSTSKGIVKSVNADGSYFVVYNCRDNWKNYQEFTAQLSDARYLFPGWPDGTPRR